MSKVRTSPCFICGHKNTFDIGMHFYSYHVCQKCGHIFSAADERGLRDMKNRFDDKCSKIKNLRIQDALTGIYFQEETIRTNHKFELAMPHIKGTTLLDARCESGKAVEKFRENGIEAYGLEDDLVCEAYWEEKPYFKRSTLAKYTRHHKFDNILLYETLEYAFCPLELILECYLRLNEGGRVIAIVPINNDPNEEFFARAQEFSDQSIWKFAKGCDPKAQVIRTDEEATVILNA